MTVKELYLLIEDYYGYRIRMLGIDSQKKEVFGVLYDSFLLRCDLNDRYERFGAGIEIANGVMQSVFLGKTLSLNNDESSIKKNLDIIDEYCRLRLPEEFLDSYKEAYFDYTRDR